MCTPAVPKIAPCAVVRDTGQAGLVGGLGDLGKHGLTPQRLEDRPSDLPDASGVSVVIRTYTEARWADLIASVASVKAQTTPPAEIIVVVDHHPRLLDRVRERLSDVIVLENDQPQGASGSLNSGVAAARGAIVAFLDDDAVAAPDWLAVLIAPYKDCQVLGVGGEIVPVWTNGRPLWFPEEFNWVVGCTYPGTHRYAAPVRNLIGANMSLRRSVAQSIGGFRVEVGAVGGSMLRGEETELCIRASQHWPGHTWLHEPRARVYHRQPEHRARWSYFRAICFGQGVTKAQIAQLLGMRDGLSCEWQYVLSTLPIAVVRNIGRALLRFDLAGFVRAGAIVAGFTLTTVGYIVGASKLALASLWQTAEMPGAPPIAAPALAAEEQLPARR